MDKGISYENYLSGIQEIMSIEEILGNYFVDIYVENGTSSSKHATNIHNESIIHPSLEKGFHNSIPQKA